MKSKVKLIIKDTGKYGKGAYAGENIRKGTVIFTLGGHRMDVTELVEKVTKGSENLDDPFQIGRRTYFDLNEMSRTFNHSCDPTCGLRKNSELFALRDIEKGEQITYDYSMTMSPTDWEMKCMCGTKICRKKLGDVTSVPKAQLEKYKRLGAVQRYMKKLLKEIEAKKYKVPKYELIALEKLKAAGVQ